MIDSLQEARKAFFLGIETTQGTYCPCCDRYGKLYKRKLNRGIARCLTWLYIEDCDEQGSWHDRKQAPRYVLESGEIGKLAHWGLAEEQPNRDDPTKRKSGIWRITRRGRAFVEDRMKVPSHAYIYDNICTGKTKISVDISYCLGEPFNYTELMRASPP